MVKTLDEITTLNILPNIKAGESFGKALDLALGVMRNTPHTRLEKSAFELHFGREPNTELSNMLKLNEIKNSQITIPFQQNENAYKFTHSVEKAVAPTICQ